MGGGGSKSIHTTRRPPVQPSFFLCPGDVVAVFVAAAALAAVLDVLPVVFPLLPPLELTVAHRARLRGQVLMTHGRQH